MLAAAEHLFAERGFHAASVRDIAAEAGVSHALLHRYLGSKEAILTAAMKRNTGPVLGVAQAAGSVREAVPGMFRELRLHRRDYLKLLARMGMDRVPFDTLKPEFPAYAHLIELLEADAAQRGRELPDHVCSLHPSLRSRSDGPSPKTGSSGPRDWTTWTHGSSRPHLDSSWRA